MPVITRSAAAAKKPVEEISPSSKKLYDEMLDHCSNSFTLADYFNDTNLFSAECYINEAPFHRNNLIYKIPLEEWNAKTGLPLSVIVKLDNVISYGEGFIWTNKFDSSGTIYIQLHGGSFYSKIGSLIKRDDTIYPLVDYFIKHRIFSPENHPCIIFKIPLEEWITKTNMGAFPLDDEEICDLYNDIKRLDGLIRNDGECNGGLIYFNDKCCYKKIYIEICRTGVDDL